MLVPIALAGAVATAGVGAATTTAARKSAGEQVTEQAATVARLVDDSLRRRGSGSAGKREVRAIARASGARVRLTRKRGMPARADSDGAMTFAFRLTDRKNGRGPRTVIVTMSDSPVVAAGQRALYWSVGAIAAGILMLLILLRRLVRSQVLRPLRALGERMRGMNERGTASAVPPEGGELGAIVGVDGIHATMTELASQAATDPLTGAANRRAFDTALHVELGRAQRHESSLALVVFDFDGFKGVNDRYGHSAGDDLLRSVAEKLLAQLRATDMLARIGGDEFALILPDMRPERAREVVERMRQAATVTIEDVELTWCAGVACYPAHAEDPKTLFECADGALYFAKEQGVGCSVVYDPAQVSISRTQGERNEIAALLADPKAITPVYQPIVSLATGRVSGYEALARFKTPPSRRPDEWFALAHRVGLGPELEARAVEVALSAPRRHEGTYLSFNLSPSALASQVVQDILPEDLTDLVIEITEHERVTDEDELRAILAPLRERGARIAVDDAGAGYAGLQQVMRVHPDIIKLDRSLVADVDTDPAKQALIDAFVRFASNTGAVVCAEGIETADELRVVADLDVTYGQGFGLARPAAPWATPAHWVSTALARSGLRTSDAGERQEETGETRLANASARIAHAGSLAELPQVEAALVAELEAHEVALLRCAPIQEDGGSALESVSQRRWMGYGTVLRERHYRTLNNVVTSGDSIQVIDGDAGADPGELALLKRSGGGALLMAPVIGGGRTLGVLMLVRESDKRWSRADVSRARMLAFALAPLLAAPAAAPQLAPVADEPPATGGLSAA